MDRNADLIDLLRALNAEGAKYLIVGGYADIFIGTDVENASAVWRALQSFGAPLESLREEDLAQPETFFIMGREPNQIDIITTIDGVTFEEAWENRVASTYGDEPVYFIGRDELIRNKTAAGRPQDLADVAFLAGDGGNDGT